MNKIILLMTMLLPCLVGSVRAQEIRPEYGRATQVQGKYVFFHAEPVQPYERAFSFINAPTFTGCPNAQDIAGAALRLARAEAQEQQKDFDAIIIQPGERDIAIKFSSVSTDNSLERAEQREGKYTFILAIPATDYEQVLAIKSSAYSISLMTKEACLSTEQILLALIRKAIKGKPFDAVVYSGTMSEAIRFKK